MESVCVGVRGPYLLRYGFEKVLAELPDVVPAAASPVVLLLLGDGWETEWERLSGAVSPPRGVLVADGHSDLLRATRLGITAFLAPDASPEELGRAIQAAACGRSYCSPALLTRLVTSLQGARSGEEERSLARSRRWLSLSARERQVAACALTGLRNEAVAAQLGLSVATVKFHLSHVYQKLRIECRSQLVQYLPEARETAGLLAVPERRSGTR
jgi:DNA-binding NarL/FixJ family response regulator